MYYRDLVTGSPTTTHTVRKISFGITLLNAFNDYRSLIVQSDYIQTYKLAPIDGQ